MIKKPKLLYLAAGAAVIGVGLLALSAPAEARPRGEKHMHFHHFNHFKHRFHAERHIYVVPVVRPRVVKVAPRVTVAATQWVKKCGETPGEA
jgi:hypothetical protein